jgi:tetratricopeptide (TPR) repeat protein
MRWLQRALLFLTFVSSPFFAKSLEAAARDYNGEGFAAYQRGDFVKARPLFESAIKQNPKLAFAWLNQARTIVAISGGTAPEEYCDFENNWIYQALASLSKAIELDSKAVLEKVPSTTGPGFKKFMTSPEFKKWWIAVQPLPKSPAEISKFLLAHKDWITEVSLNARDYATFKTGGNLELLQVTPVEKSTKAKWKVSGSMVEVSPKRKFKVERKQFFFDNGEKFYFFVALEELGGKDAQWTLGPLTGDCD